MGIEYKFVNPSILDFILDNWSYLNINLIQPKNLDDVFNWCYENLEKGWYHHRKIHHRMIYFENSDDKFLFELTWL